MVIVMDWLSKGVITDGLKDISTESVVDQFLQYYYPYHFLPIVIVSDWEAQFTGVFQKRVYNRLAIQYQLSTVFLSEIDRSTKKANETIETVLQELVDWSQIDWMK